MTIFQSGKIKIGYDFIKDGKYINFYVRVKSSAKNYYLLKRKYAHLLQKLINKGMLWQKKILL